MSPGDSKHLRWSAERVELAGDARILDLCCGTGLSTEALRVTYPNATITGLDASEGMLEAARAKTELNVDWVLGHAMDPAAAGAVGPFDGILMAYGIRNVPDPDLCLERLRGLLTEDGTLCMHEYSVAGSAWARFIWNFVTLSIVIPLGLVFAGTDPTRADSRSRWREHEAILPAAAILKDLAASEDAACRNLAEPR